MTGSRRPFTREMYDAMVRAFRDYPGNYAQCALRAHVDHRTAKKAWERGWKQYPWARAIRDVLMDEAAEAKRRRAEQRIAEEARRADEAEQKIENARKATTEEGRIVANVRANVLASAMMYSQLAKALIPIAQRLDTDLAKEYAAGTIKPLQTLKMLGEFTKGVRLQAHAAQLALEITRLESGKPIHVIAGDDSSPEQVAQELEVLTRTLRRARAAGMMDDDLRDAMDSPNPGPDDEDPDDHGMQH